jgi:hypothetical protein
MEVVKVGPLVTAVEVGDIVIMGDPRTTGMAQMEFAGEAYSQISEHSIIGKVPLGKAKLKEMIKP